jgi:hypothetical protein
MMNSLELLTKEREKAKAVYLEYSNNRSYYEEQKDKKIQQTYYQNISLERNCIHNLLEKTHRNKLNYSPHSYVYPWVDLHENRKLKSIYSGSEMDPLIVIEEDIQILDTPVIYVQHNEDEGLDTNSPNWNIHHMIAPFAGDTIIQKHKPDSFHDTNLHTELVALGIRKVVLVGLQTDMCIDATCRRANELGYQVTVVLFHFSTYVPK